MTAFSMCARNKCRGGGAFRGATAFDEFVPPLASKSSATRSVELYSHTTSNLLGHGRRRPTPSSASAILHKSNYAHETCAQQTLAPTGILLKQVYPQLSINIGTTQLVRKERVDGQPVQGNKARVLGGHSVEGLLRKCTRIGSFANQSCVSLDLSYTRGSHICSASNTHASSPCAFGQLSYMFLSASFVLPRVHPRIKTLKSGRRLRAIRWRALVACPIWIGRASRRANPPTTNIG